MKGNNICKNLTKKDLEKLFSKSENKINLVQFGGSIKLEKLNQKEVKNITENLKGLRLVNIKLRHKLEQGKKKHHSFLIRISNSTEKETQQLFVLITRGKDAPTIS